MHDLDLTWMQHALKLAERGRGFVEPNPLVGAVMVRGSDLVGEGWHQRFGQAHAEVHALAAAGDRARGATLYVTLEPCCHHGKTPPCTDAILRAGVTRVVAAMTDPFPRVAGQGASLLRAAGVEVEIGVCEKEAHRLNAPYLKLLTKGRPWIHAKWAMTLDGKIATRAGDSRWISGEASRRRVHELRGRMDAVIVGMGTVQADDPLLTARPPGPRTPTRIVLDRRAELPLHSQLVRTAGDAPVLVAATAAPADRAALLRDAGCELLPLPAGGGAAEVMSLLDELGRRRFTNALVEGGSAVLGSFLDAGAIDEVHVFIAPILCGGEKAVAPIGGHGVEQIAEAWRLGEWRLDSVAGDILLHGWR